MRRASSSAPGDGERTVRFRSPLGRAKDALVADDYDPVPVGHKDLAGPGTAVGGGREGATSLGPGV